VQSTRLADPFEPLNSSLAQSAEGSYGIDKATENCCLLGRNRSTNISYAGSQSVNIHTKQCIGMKNACANLQKHSIGNMLPHGSAILHFSHMR